MFEKTVYWEKAKRKKSFLKGAVIMSGWAHLCFSKPHDKTCSQPGSNIIAPYDRLCMNIYSGYSRIYEQLG